MNVQNDEPSGRFDQPVTLLPGVAGKRASLLHRLDIRTWYDLLSWFPRGFEDWSETTPVAELADGQEMTFLAKVARKPSVQRKGRLSMLRTVLRDDSSAIAAIWFNQPYLADRLVPGEWYRFRGKIRRSGRVFSVQNPSFEPERPDEPPKPGIRPIYPLTEGLSQGVMRQLIQAVLPRLIGYLPEPLPAWVRREYKLCAVDFAWSRIHQPGSHEEAEICRRRIAFEELFLLQAGLRLLRVQRRQSASCWPMLPGEDAMRQMDDLICRLPFRLTGAQQRVWQDIRQDLAGDRPMNRLVQGDVGSGKTVLAALAMAECALCGMQAVLMAPTSILARQHVQTLGRLLESSGEEIALLTGATPPPERRKLLAGLAEGSIRLLVGTHALIEDQVRFQKLALAVTDEQHRFGVRQRIRLGEPDRGAGESGKQPHVLVMSATPIPRTLGLILYGDLDISVIDEMPAGRKPVETYTAGTPDRARIENLIRRFAGDGRQIYVVCPMIEENAETDLESAIAVYSRLAQTVFPDLQVGLLHGSLKQNAKDQVMDRFIQGEIQILVSTTVIEVGVDNPNAALMVVENAERFGLAQLHQLRGRIGRGSWRSICVLMSDTEDELARERLKMLCHSADGFAVAEKDLELRGPGDFFGTRQHGLPSLKIANLYRDRELLTEVQEGLERLFREDPELAHPENNPVRTALHARYGSVFQQVGL
jgi:ATP-dependent DNA helicase RecG